MTFPSKKSNFKDFFLRRSSVKDAPLTISWDVEFYQVLEVLNVGWQLLDLVVAQAELAESMQSEKVLEGTNKLQMVSRDCQNETKNWRISRSHAHAHTTRSFRKGCRRLQFHVPLKMSTMSYRFSFGLSINKQAPKAIVSLLILQTCDSLNPKPIPFSGWGGA